MTVLERTRMALAISPARFIRHELGSVGSHLKGAYYAVIEGKREIIQTTKEATDQLARAGVVKAGPYQQDADCYDFHQS